MRVLVKICGLASEEAVEAALEAGADALGFVLAPSPRQVTLARARELLARVPPGIERIAVFAQATRAELERALELDFDGLQAEVPEVEGAEIPPLRSGVFSLPVLRDGPTLLERLERVPRERGGPWRSLRGAIVLDGPQGGGRGIPVDAGRARRAAELRPLVLAGGLSAENAAARVRRVRPFAVDASSGLERERGLKDPERIRSFVAAVRAVEAELAAREESIP